MPTLQPDPYALYLALDQGGHASRALIFDSHGNPVAQALVPIETQHTGPHIEHDPEQLVTSLLHAATQACEQLGSRVQLIVAAGLATQRSSIACWDRYTGAALAPVISWQDRRAAAWLASRASAHDEVRQRTGLPLSPHYGASKLHWLLAHNDAVQQAALTQRLAYGPLASFLVFRLTQQHTLMADPANAGRTLLWNRHTRNWDTHLSVLFDVPLTPLPPCQPSRGYFGHLCAPAPALPLRVVTGDQSAALFALGEPSPTRLFINLGTGAFVQHIQSHPTEHAHNLLNSVVFDDGHMPRYALEGTVNGAGSAIAWFADQHGITDWTLHSASWLSDTRPIPVFINGVGGVGSPYWRPEVESRFIGTGDISQCLRAVVESILFLILDNLHAFAEAGVTAHEISVSGGLSRHDSLCQWLADLSGHPVIRTDEQEATARGLAWLLAAEHGTPAFFLPPTQVFKPQSNTELVLRYQKWHDLMQV